MTQSTTTNQQGSRSWVGLYTLGNKTQVKHITHQHRQGNQNSEWAGGFHHNT